MQRRVAAVPTSSPNVCRLEALAVPRVAVDTGRASSTLSRAEVVFSAAVQRIKGSDDRAFNGPDNSRTIGPTWSGWR